MSGTAKNAVIAVLVLAAILAYSSAYTVDEREQVVITRFRKVVGDAITEPGLKFKWPVVDKVIRFPRNLQDWDGQPGQVPTRDKTYIWVDTFARWKITDPVVFYRSVGNLDGARARLDDIIDPAVRNAITSHQLIETVRWTDRKLDTFEVGLEESDQPAIAEVEVGRQEITRMIREAAAAKVADFGIELVDVKIKRLNYRQEVRQAVYDRMVAERRQIAEKYRSEGQGEARRIRGEMEKELKQIQSEAYRTAQEIKGKADAEATTIYAEAYGRDPEFYSFMRTLDMYQESLSKDSTVVFTTRSEFFQYLKSLEGTRGASAP